MLSIYLVNVGPGLPEEKYQYYMKLLPEERQKRIKAFLRREDSERALIGQLLSRLGIIKALNLHNSEIAFETNSYGKPHLAGCDNYFFNISHSGDWVALAYDSMVVGIDVEKCKPIDMDIAKRFFSSREYADLMAKPEEEQNSYFFDLWTLKESYIKALGKGLSQPLDSFAMVFNGEHFEIQKEDEDEWYFRQYPLAEGYKLSVCASHPVFPEKINILSLEDFHKFFTEWQGFWE